MSALTRSLSDNRMSDFSRQIHGSTEVAESPTPRLLLIAYHFPPGGSAGALRWEKMLEVLLEHGFAADVLTLDPAQLSSPDLARLSKVDESVRVFGVRDSALAVEGAWRFRAQAIRFVSRSLRRLRVPSRGRAGEAAPHHTQRLGGSISRWEALQDAGPRLDRWRASLGAHLEILRFTEWADRARRVAEWLADETSYDAVISSGPPHAIHLGAATAARRIGAAFVMDMRDPWSLVQRLPKSIGSSRWWKTAERAEGSCVRMASLVLCNTERAASALSELYPELVDRIVTVLNGVDEEKTPSVPKNDRFILAHAGTVYLDRSPESLFRAVGRIVQRRELTADDLAIRFFGAFEGRGEEAVVAMAYREGVAPFVELGGVVSRSEVLAFLAESAVGIILPQDSHLAVPSKVFEYVNLPLWTVALAQEESATSDVLAMTDACVVDPLDVPALEAVIERLYDRWQRGERPTTGSFDPSLSRRQQAVIFAQGLKRVLSGQTFDEGEEATGGPMPGKAVPWKGGA